MSSTPFASSVPVVIAVHDDFMALAHVLADELLGMRQTGNDIALAVGDQDRGRRRQEAALASFRCSDSQVEIEPGKDDTSDLAVRVAIAQREMDHLLASRRILPVIADGEPVGRQRPLEGTGCPATDEYVNGALEQKMLPVASAAARRL